MGKVHTVLLEHGRQTALQFGLDHRVVETAASYLSCEDSETAFLFSGWAYTALPHKRLADDAPWTVRTDQASVVVQPGLRVPQSGEPIAVGVPFGSRARLIMLYLQSEAVKNSSREIELGSSMNAWLKKMGIPGGGRTTNDVRDQADRIARCRLTFQFRQGAVSGLVNQHILDQALFVDEQQGGNPVLLETARLSEAYYEQLQRHPLPLEESAIKQISNNSIAIDTYTWLAYRLHCLKIPVDITWRALFDQFGHGFTRVDNFRMRFKESLQLALAVYPEANVEITTRGLRLLPSPPAVTQRVIRVGLPANLQTR